MAVRLISRHVWICPRCNLSRSSPPPTLQRLHGVLPDVVPALHPAGERGDPQAARHPAAAAARYLPIQRESWSSASPFSSPAGIVEAVFLCVPCCRHGGCHSDYQSRASSFLGPPASPCLAARAPQPSHQHRQRRHRHVSESLRRRPPIDRRPLWCLSQ